MKILYGVQGTGNGHLTRARAMARALARYPQVHVDWLFSGRERGDFFDMECFGAWQWRRGLSFATRAGRVRPLATLRQLSPGEFLRDMRERYPEIGTLSPGETQPQSQGHTRLHSDSMPTGSVKQRR